MIATFENLTPILSLREFHENFFNNMDYKILRRFPSALVKEISLGSLVVNLETF